MKLSLNWLRDFVDITDTPRNIGQKLTEAGLALESLEQSGDDTVIELDVTTNRPDCLNHLGVAREIGALYSLPLKRSTVQAQEISSRAENAFSISIADADLCNRYCGRYISGVRIGPSPSWLQERLEAVGVRSINNVADVTNYVLMELGHPLHAFDADKLDGRQIVVRRAHVDEKMTTLDGVERSLAPSTLVIADADRAVAVAGVMGGATSEISPSTTNVLLESAYFDPLSIRKTSRALGLSTEASYRFERGADIEMARTACDRAAAMIRELAGGEILQGIIDIYPVPRKPVTANLRRSRIKGFLGRSVEDTIVERILERLEFGLTRTTEGWTVEVPSFRVDVTREEDLLEEIARHHGYDKFPATLPPWSEAGTALPYEPQERQLRNLLSGMGYTEIIGLAFRDEETEKKFRPSAEPVRLMNPMSEDQSILRTSLVSTILETMVWNLNRGIRDLQIYELGKIYRTGQEQRALILAVTGSLRPKGVHEVEREFNFYDLKGDVEEVLDAFDANCKTPSGATNDGPVLRDAPYYHPGRSALAGNVAIYGELHPDYAMPLKLRQRVYLAELDVESILRSSERLLVRPVPRFPSIRRDLSLLLDKNIRYGDVHALITGMKILELTHVEPFDRLENGPFPDSKYSLSISLTYRSNERTLTDEEVDILGNQILTILQERLGASLRK